MIESGEKYTAWLNGLQKSHNPLLLHVIPLHDGLHAAENTPTLLFIKDLKTEETVYYSFGHPDARQLMTQPHSQLIQDLSEYQGVKWAIDQKDFGHLVPIKDVFDVGVGQWLKDNNPLDTKEFDTKAHSLIRRNFGSKPNFNNFVPLVKHREVFEELAEVAQKIIKKTEIDDSFRQFHSEIIAPLAQTEKQGLWVNPKVFEEHFGNVLSGKTRVFTQYNVYTSTGRPSNRFGGINYAALNKEDGSRKSFVSRWGDEGKLVLIDYSTFHPRIVSLLTDYPIPTTVDIYEYLAKLYFNKPVVDESDIADAKQITFRQFFGGVEEKYQHIKYLAHMKSFIDFHWRFFNEHGYVETPLFKRKITKEHIQTPKPATVFNYIMQAVEGEISIPILGQINKILEGGKTQAVLYTYDAILFDYHVDDDLILASIRDLMGLDGKFPTKVYVGDNYHDMEQVA